MAHIEGPDQARHKLCDLSHREVTSEAAKAALSKRREGGCRATARLKALAAFGHGDPPLRSEHERLGKVLRLAENAPEGHVELRACGEPRAIEGYASWTGDPRGYTRKSRAQTQGLVDAGIQVAHLLELRAAPFDRTRGSFRGSREYSANLFRQASEGAWVPKQVEQRAGGGEDVSSCTGCDEHASLGSQLFQSEVLARLCVFAREQCAPHIALTLEVLGGLPGSSFRKRLGEQHELDNIFDERGEKNPVQTEAEDGLHVPDYEEACC